MDRLTFFKLLDKCKEGTASPAEWRVVEEYYRRLEELGSTHLSRDEELSLKEKIYRKILDETGIEERSIKAPELFIEENLPRIRFIYRRAIIAASILLMVGTGTYFLFLNNRSGNNGIAKTIAPANDDVKAPALNRAMITTASGQRIYLDSAANGTLATEGNVKVIKLAEGKIVYNGSAGESFYNTLTNPRGSKVIDMLLSDGSRIWLNAGSSVTYPVTFIGNERKVSMTGEAYFEVSHDASRPFYVINRDAQVQVLGTHFNVNAYDDEDDIKVTLLEGSVKVINQAGSKSLKPGEQARVHGDINVISDIETDEVMAWKNGKFQFGEKADIGTIMRQIARWYDVDVAYSGTFTKHFGGSMSRDVNVSQVLKVLEATGNVKCKVEGRKVIVTAL